MPLFIQYLVKLSISLGGVWLFYQLLLRRLTFYNWNRAFLVGYSLIAFFIPFINISPVLEKNDLSGNKIVQFIPLVQTFSSVNKELSIGAWDWVLLVFTVGCVLLFVRLLILHISFLKLKRSARLLLESPVKLYELDKDIIPFSFGDSIFINPNQHGDEDLAEIIRHEFVHVKQKHSLDILLAEWLCILNWYNPFAWLIRSAIRQNLEFIADNNVVENGIGKKQYQYLLLKVMGTSQYHIAANFNFTSLKKRIAMMNKMKSAKVHLMKFLFVLPLLGVLLISFRDSISRQVITPVNARSLTGDTIPVRPAAPQKPGLPKNVKSFSTVNSQVTVTLKDGTIEKYDLNDPDERALFEKKFGSLPEPPAPPQPIAPTEVAVPVPPVPPVPPIVPVIPANVSAIEIDNNKATIKHKDGKIERYDLNKFEERQRFEKKYGEIVPAAPKAPIPPRAPAARSVRVTIPTMTVQSEVTAATSISAPVSVTTSTSTEAMTVSAEIVEIQPVFHDMTGWEKDEIVIEIRKGITASELALQKKQLLERGYVLEISTVDYHNGLLKSIDGSIADDQNKSGFGAEDFNKIIISKIRYKDGKSGFRVRIENEAVRL